MKSIIVTFIEDRDSTIGKLLKRKGFGSQLIYQEIKAQHVFLNDIPINSKNIKTSQKDKVKVILNDEINDLYENSEPLKIVYEDDYILVVNKPYNLDVEPSLHTETNNLASMITYYFNKNQIKSKVHLVNRIDKLTTGLVVVAKSRYIKSLFANVNFVKKYECLVEGIVNEAGVIKNHIKKIEHQSKRVEANDGKYCETIYTPKEVIGLNTLLDVQILTGRTHQIRLSLANKNHPLVNDPLYGTSGNGEMYLKAYYIKFDHPILDKVIELKI